LRARPRAGNLQQLAGCLQENFDNLQEKLDWLLLLKVLVKVLPARGRVLDEGDQQPYLENKNFVNNLHSPKDPTYI
jgi:hypothetical protein